MLTMDSTLRSRKPIATENLTKDESQVKFKRSSDDNDNESTGISLMDIIRVLSGILLLSCLFSWFVTDGESVTWGYRPKISRWRTLKSLFKPSVNLTDAELALYGGQEPAKPIYVAINGSVFDVSANQNMYGPGGGYHFFAGRDAARAFVSGCFREDLTWDLRGLEEMFITGDVQKQDEKEAEEIRELETLEKEGKLGDGLGMHEKVKKGGRLRWLQRRHDKRRQEAWAKVEKQIQHWDNFFRNHARYYYVGTVVHPSIAGEPLRQLCKKQGKP